MTFRDIAKVRVAREKVLQTKTGRLDWVHNRIALGEACLVMGVWGQGGEEDFTKVSHESEFALYSFLFYKPSFSLLVIYSLSDADEIFSYLINRELYQGSVFDRSSLTKPSQKTGNVQLTNSASSKLLS